MINPTNSLFLSDIDYGDSLFNKLVFFEKQADPLCCRTEWQLSFHEAFSPFRRLIFRSEGNSMIAFASYNFPGVGRVIEPLETHWFFACPLLGEQPVDLLFTLLREKPFSQRLPHIVVSGLLDDSSLRTKLKSTFNRYYDLILLEQTFYRSASLEGGMDGYLSRRSAKLRKNIKYAMKRARGEGIVFETIKPSSLEEADSLYDKIVDVEKRSWKGINQCGITMQPSYNFYRLLVIRTALSRTLKVLFAIHDGKYIGYMFGAVAGGFFRGQQFSYDDSYHDYSIGNLLQVEMIQRLVNEGIVRYDMGQDMLYKTHWAEMQLKTETILLRPKVVSI